SVTWYQTEGFLPAAILNYLALMAWSHPEGKEIFSLDEFVKFVELKDLKPVAPIFDVEKLKWMNGEYMRMMEDEMLLTHLKDFYKENADVQKVLVSDHAKEIVALAKTRMKTLKEFSDLVLLLEIPYSDEEEKVAVSLRNSMEKITEWNKDTILAAMREVLTEQKVKGNVLYKVFTGRERGLPLPESLTILGKEKTLERLSKIV
ncbi:MAG: glutamate--tRNA ligase family protein, partial [Candidatus Levyibacteriota bacterium]